MSDIYKYDTDEIFSPDEEVIHEQNKTIERLQEQIYEANGIIGELYHLCYDKKKASSVVCDYLVRYGKTVGVEDE